MRGIGVGVVLSVLLWTVLAWAVACTCTCLDAPWFSASITALMGSLACINLAAIATAVWLASVCADEGRLDVTAAEAVWID